MGIHEPVPTRSVSEDGNRSAGEPQSPCVAGSAYHFSVAQYHEMIAAGILGEGERIELLEGGVLQMSPKGPRHVFAVQALLARLTPMLPAGWHARCQDPITLLDSELAGQRLGEILVADLMPPGGANS